MPGRGNWRDLGLIAPDSQPTQNSGSPDASGHALASIGEYV